jgi:SagB-type dehydrogenase family enzyme
MLFRYFHDATKSPAGSIKSHALDEIRPYKEYPRFEQLALPEPQHLDIPLSEAFDRRESTRSFDTNAQVTPLELGSVLAAAMKEELIGDTRRRRVPSGGGLYPLEAYVVAQRIQDTQPGIYHYRPRTHALENLSPVASQDAFIQSLTYPWSKDAAAFIVLSAVWNRSAVKYGDLAYRLTLLEAGHAMQNMLLTLSPLSLVGVPLLGFLPEKTEESLGFAEDDESALYLVALGRPTQ